MLQGKVAVVPLGDLGPAVARRLASAGATVVLVAAGTDTTAAGRLAAEIEAEAGTGRAAVFAGDDLDGLVEFVSELFRPDRAG